VGNGSTNFFGFAHKDKFVFSEDKKIEEIENPGGVDDQEGKEPIALVVAG